MLWLSCGHTHRHTLKNQDGTTMANRWPAGTISNGLIWTSRNRSCPVCGRDMHVCDHRYHHLWTLQGPPAASPPGALSRRLMRESGCTFSPEAESSSVMPRWCLGWECFVGSRLSALVGASASCRITGHTPDPGCPMMPSSTYWPVPNPCWRQDSKTLHSSLMPTGISRRWCDDRRIATGKGP